jgi:hypothetical protein
MMAAMAAALAHVIIAESYGHLSWQSLSGTIIAFVAVWAFFDWAIGSWVYKRERARQLKEAQRYGIAGCWGAVLTPQAEKEPVGVSVLNIHSDSNRLSVTGQSFDLKRDKDGKVTLTLGGDWHSTKAAFSGNSLFTQASRSRYRGCASTHSPGKIRPCRHGDTTALFMTWEARAKLFAAGVKAIQ